MADRNFELASQNAPVIENAANEAASNNFNNIQKMKQEIDWSALMGSAAVAQPKIVDPQVVTDMFNSFLSIPTEVNIGFKNEAGYLKMTVSMNFREKFIRNFETYADYKLVTCMVAAMGGTIPAPEGYLAEEHVLEASDTDPREDLFVQFLNSPYRCHIEPDFVSAKGERYLCASFAPGYRKVVRFCLKRTEELENVIQRFINDAVHAA
jgi:hypothetical protein